MEKSGFSALTTAPCTAAASFLILLILSAISFAATRTSTAAGGNWNSTATWGGDPVPVAGDDVIIATSGGNKVLINTVATCASLTINSGAVMESGTFTLTVAGAWTNNGTFVPVTGTVSFGAGNSTIVNGSGTENFNHITISSGANLLINAPVILSGNFVMANPTTGSNKVSLNGSNSLAVTGAFTMTAPTIDNTFGKFDVGSGSLSVSGSFTMGATSNALRTDSLVVASGLVDLDGSVTTGTTASRIVFLSNGELRMAGSVSTGPPAITEGNGTVHFDGEADQMVWAETFYNLSLSGSNIKTLRGTTNVNNVLTINNSTLNYNTRTVTFTAAGTPIINNSGQISGTGTFAFATNEQTIPALIYNNLSFSGGAKTIASGTAVTANGNLTNSSTLDIENSASINIGGGWTNNSPANFQGNAGAIITGALSGSGVLTLESGTISIQGNWTNSGTTVPGTSTVQLSHPTANQTLRGNFYNLELSGSGVKSLSNTTVISGVLTVAPGSILNLSSRSLNLAGGGVPLVVNGEFQRATGTVTYSGAADQSVAGLEYNGLTFSNAGQKTLSDGTAITVNGNWALGTTGPVVMAGDASAIVTVSVTGSASLTMGSGILSVGGSFASGTFTAGTGKVHYTSATAQSVRLATYYNLELSGAGIKTLTTGTTIVTNILTVNSDAVLNLSSRILTLSGSGTPLIVFGSLTPGSSTVNYNSTGEVTIAAADYNNLNSSGGDRILPSDQTIRLTGTFTPGAGAYIIEDSTIHFNGTSTQTIPAFNYFNLEGTNGNRTFANTGTIGIAGSFVPGAGTYTVTNSTVHFNSSGNQTIAASNYNHLICSGGDRVLSPLGIIRIAGTFTPGDGNFTVSGSTIHFNASGSQTIPPFTYFNLDGTNGNRVLSSTGVIFISGAFTPGAGSYSAGTSTVHFNGTDEQVIPALVFNDVILSGGTKTVSSAITLKTLTIEPSAVLNINSDSGGVINIL